MPQMIRVSDLCVFFLFLFVFSPSRAVAENLTLTPVTTAQLEQFFDISGPVLEGLETLRGPGYTQEHRSAVFKGRHTTLGEGLYLYLFQSEVLIDKSDTGLGVTFWPAFETLQVGLDLNRDGQPDGVYRVEGIVAGFSPGTVSPNGAAQSTRNSLETVLHFFFGKPDGPFRKGKTELYGAVASAAPERRSVQGSGERVLPTRSVSQPR